MFPVVLCRYGGNARGTSFYTLLKIFKSLTKSNQMVDK